MTTGLLYLVGVVAAAGQAPPAADSWLPPPPVAGPNGRLGFVDQRLAVKAPVWESDGTSLTVQAGLRNELLQPCATAGEAPCADPVRRMNLGLDGKLRVAEFATLGGGVALDSPRDRFDDLTTLTAAVTAFVRLPAGERDAWTISVAYTPLTPAPPAPTVSYSWAPSPHFSADIGVPVPLIYTPGATALESRLDVGALTTVTGQFRLKW
jgi:hypothetical protein